MTSLTAEFVGSVRLSGDQVIVAVCGDLDVDKLSLFTDLMAQAAAFHGRSVTVDVAGVTFLDTQALQVFVRTAEQVRDTGAKLKVQGASPFVYRIFELTDLLGVLDVAQTPIDPLAPALAHDALLSREVIAIAQGVVMHRDGISPEAAHAKLRDLSRSSNKPMRALAEELVALHRDPSPTSAADGGALSRGLVSDASLMGGIAAGDEASFELLYHRYAATCLGLARRIVVDSEFAEDAVQVAFLSVWQHADRFRPGQGSVRSWLLNMTHHKAVDVVRSQELHRRRRVPQDWLLDAIDSGITPHEQAEITLDGRRAMDAIAQLTHEHREVLMLCYYGGFTQTEVAARLGLPLGTVKTRCRNALKRLRSALAVDANGLLA